MTEKITRALSLLRAVAKEIGTLIMATAIAGLTFVLFAASIAPDEVFAVICVGFLIFTAILVAGWKIAGAVKDARTTVIIGADRMQGSIYANGEGARVYMLTAAEPKSAAEIREDAEND